ncbi:GNAT family N-acetyltransferase [Campylobacter coli]|uniref:GNAT family N-acetyltransferase n=1 Tax=Campylobacter coli TaxID=195 RepID=UPI00092F8110|nr:GNAT family N-acetyltransferase [Campylobacter coli]EAK8022211.1 GNAT family N-acetyltransferase [Campylobacter coli]HEB7545094.1 GNAT family N-acetyltransferase [Campylobacter coli]HEB7552969.1 GNAT family N-acetyltransferase [Campylobacter coli]
MNEIYITGKNIDLYLVETEDAEFILKLRSEKGKYLNQVEYNINKQKEWIRNYKEREAKGEEFYFLIANKNKEKLGVVRLYDFCKNSFCWGSFIIKKNTPYYVAIEVVLQVYGFGFYKLGFQKSHFDVRKDNERVVAFHKRFGARIYKENDKDLFFTLSLKEYEKIKARYKKFIE